MRGRCYRAKTQRIRVAQPVYNLDVPRNVVQYGSDVSVQLVEGDQMVLGNRSSTNTGSFLIRQVRVWCMVPPPMGMLHGSVELAWIDSAFQDKGWFMFNPCFWKVHIPNLSTNRGIKPANGILSASPIAWCGCASFPFYTRFWHFRCEKLPIFETSGCFRSKHSLFTPLSSFYRFVDGL